MGAWSTGLYADDTTCDVRDSYVRHLKAGLADAKATQDVLSQFAELMNDRVVACLVCFAVLWRTRSGATGGWKWK